MSRKQKVVTWQSPSGRRINVTPRQEKIAAKAGVWPRDEIGEEYCTVYYGLHYDWPTYTDAEWEAIIKNLVARKQP